MNQLNSFLLASVSANSINELATKIIRNSIAKRMLSLLVLTLGMSLGVFAQSSGYIYLEGTAISDKFKDVIVSTDPTVFSSVSYLKVKKAEMWDRDANNNKGAWIYPDSWIFKLNYQDGITSEIRIRKKDFDKAKANELANKYGRKMGQLPANLREGVDYINIYKSDNVFGGNNFKKSIDITIGKTSKNYENVGTMEEILFHESTHAALDNLYGTAWKTSRNKDSKFVSKYAFDNPDREDISESYLLYAALSYRPDRVAAKEVRKIRRDIPNRISYYKNLNLKMHPWEKKVEKVKTSNNALFDTSKYYRLNSKFLGKGRSLDVINNNSNTIRLADSGNFTGQFWRIEKLNNGYYRLTTQFRGTNMSLDVINDGKNNKLRLSKTGNFTGQFWKIEKLSNGYFRLTTAFQGVGKSLDVVNDGMKSNVQLAPTGNFTGQQWMITKIN